MILLLDIQDHRVSKIFQLNNFKRNVLLQK